MKIKVFLIVLTVIALGSTLFATGCGKKEQPAQIADAMPNNACLVLLEGNATTGYSWVATAYDSAKLIVAELPYIPDDVAEEMAGAGGTYRFYIQPVNAAAVGEYDVKFNYEQPWDGGDKSGGTASVHVVVSDIGVAQCSDPIITMGN